MIEVLSSQLNSFFCVKTKATILSIKEVRQTTHGQTCEKFKLIIQWTCFCCLLYRMAPIKVCTPDNFMITMNYNVINRYWVIWLDQDVRHKKCVQPGTTSHTFLQLMWITTIWHHCNVHVGEQTIIRPMRKKKNMFASKFPHMLKSIIRHAMLTR